LTGVPLVYGCCIRKSQMQYVLTLDAPIRHPPSGDRNGDVRSIMERLVKRLEVSIRESPEQYLWAHRRWRLPEPRQPGP